MMIKSPGSEILHHDPSRASARPQMRSPVSTSGGSFFGQLGKASICFFLQGSLEAREAGRGAVNISIVYEFTKSSCL